MRVGLHELHDVSCMRRVRYCVVRISVGSIAISYANVLAAKRVGMS